MNKVSVRSLNTKQEAVAQDAIAELRKLAAATDVGISKPSYSSMLIPAKAVAERAVRELPDGELKKGIADTFDAYKDAHVLWDIMKNDTGYFACLNQPDTTGMDELKKLDVELSCHPVGGELARRYKIPIRNLRTQEILNPKDINNKKGLGEVNKSEGLSVIWKEARLRLEVSSGLLSKLTSSP